MQRLSKPDETRFATLDFTRSELWILLCALYEVGEPPSSGDLQEHNDLKEMIRFALTLEI